MPSGRCGSCCVLRSSCPFSPPACPSGAAFGFAWRSPSGSAVSVRGFSCVVSVPFWLGRSWLRRCCVPRGAMRQSGKASPSVPLPLILCIGSVPLYYNIWWGVGVRPVHICPALPWLGFGFVSCVHAASGRLSLSLSLAAPCCHRCQPRPCRVRQHL